MQSVCFCFLLSKRYLDHTIPTGVEGHAVFQILSCCLQSNVGWCAIASQSTNTNRHVAVALLKRKSQFYQSGRSATTTSSLKKSLKLNILLLGTSSFDCPEFKDLWISKWSSPWVAELQEPGAGMTKPKEEMPHTF